MTIDFGHANPHAKYKVNMARFGWFPDEVHLEGYDDVDDEGERDTQRRERIQASQDSDSDLSELTDDE